MTNYYKIPNKIRGAEGYSNDYRIQFIFCGKYLTMKRRLNYKLESYVFYYENFIWDMNKELWIQVYDLLKNLNRDNFILAFSILNNYYKEKYILNIDE